MKTNKTEPATHLKKNGGTPLKNRFPIVGIGASAGGLEALEQFLMNVPDSSGMAYVIIQHLDPTQKGMLPELLQRVLKMKVFQVEDRLEIEPDCVYVIPPNKSMSVFKGRLHLFDPIEARGLRLPIDFFLRSLADDQKEAAIGIILSGMGSDGSAGIRAIKENNGVVLAQEPESAKFDSMPRNAIDSGMVDIIAQPDKLAHELIVFLKHVPVVRTKPGNEIKDKSAFDRIIILLRTHTGNDFSQYKKNTVYRRIERRMGVHKIGNINSYIHFLQENPKEIHILFKEIMIGVTDFFRDSQVWEKLKEKLLPARIGKMAPGSTLRSWIPGCSTGEEAYSFAIIFKEVIENIYPDSGISLQIFASDLDNEAIDSARKGLFPDNISVNVSSKRLSRFFNKTEEGYRICSEIREMIVFAQHNIIMHPPFTNIDFISCRNLLIYMDTELQRKLFSLFYYSLNPDGILLLGTSETPGVQSYLFSPVDSGLKIYTRSATHQDPGLFDFPSSFSRPKSGNYENKSSEKPIMNIQNLADQLILNQFSPAGVLVNENGDILYISGRTGKYLEPAVGKANLNIFAMLRPGFQNDFAMAFRKVLMKRETIILHKVTIGSNDVALYINVSIHWINKPEILHGKIMIIFTDLPETTELRQPIKKGRKTHRSIREAELENELQLVREEMQSMIEEMQTSQEEMKSTNEELQSTNEELQSTNEELTTSKEEMQSLNEELQTVNAELQSKVDDYTRVNNDMKNLLNSTDIATLFLDKELNVRRFTNQATKIFKLIKSDIGRPFTDQVSQLIYPDLADDALEVLRTLIFIEKQIPTKDGRWYSIRIMPYRTFDDRIDGLVITFINISDFKRVASELDEMQQLNRLLTEQSGVLTIQLTSSLVIRDFNSEAEMFFGRKHDEVVNHNFIELFIPKPLQNDTKETFSRLLLNPESKLEIQVIAAHEKVVMASWLAKVVFNNALSPSVIMLSGQ